MLLMKSTELVAISPEGKGITERSKSGLTRRNSGDLTRQGHKHNGMIINHATNGKQGAGQHEYTCIKNETPNFKKVYKKDIQALFLILKDEEANQFLPWYPLKSLEEAKNFYEERYAAKYAQPQAYAYAVCLKEDDFPIGYIKVDLEEPHDLAMDFVKSFGTGNCDRSWKSRGGASKERRFSIYHGNPRQKTIREAAM